MKPKKIAFFSALLLLLLGFYYFYEIRWTARQREKAEASKKVLNVDAEQVEQISLKKPDRVIILEKKGEDWFLTEPIKMRADTWAVEQIVDTLADGTWEREVSPLPEDLADFGLADSKMEVTVCVKDLSGPYKVLVGGENPTGNMRYVRVNQEKRILLVYARFADVLDKGADDLRDKRILRFDEDAIAKMFWRINDESFTVEKKEDRWTVVEPDGEKIGESQITSLIWRLEGLKFKNIFEKPDHPLSYYGLDKPSGAIKLMDQDGELIGDLRFGVRKETTVSYFAKTEGGGTVYELSYDFTNDLPKPEQQKGEKEDKEKS
jgi:hypothetical protein